MTSKALIALGMALCPLMAEANDSTATAARQPDVLGRMENFSLPGRTFMSGSYRNPALVGFMSDVSLSRISADFRSTESDRPIISYDGTGINEWGFTAESYTRYKTSALWGDAAYRNGRRHSVQWCENADAELIYPYFSADEIGGDMNSERYEFNGGYADRRGRWAYGASLGYKAGLYYRSIDPRPRNVTGSLNVSAGAAFGITGGYMLGASANFMKYKQSSDIKFVSEMGEAPVYHLSGLGNHYSRFAGASKSVNYSGTRIGATLDLYPSGRRGAVVSAGFSRFTFRKILRDLNKLPLNTAWHNAVTVSAGYRDLNWGAATEFAAYRRHGSENIFGDAASGVYPQIGTLEMYADNMYEFGASGFFTGHFGRATASVSGRAAWRHRREIYAAPECERLIEDFRTRLTVSCTTRFTRSFLMSAELLGTLTAPTSTNLLTAAPGKNDPDGLTAIIANDFLYASHTHGSIGAGLSAAHAIGRRFAITLTAAYTHSRYTAATYDNEWTVALGLTF